MKGKLKMIKYKESFNSAVSVKISSSMSLYYYGFAPFVGLVSDEELTLETMQGLVEKDIGDIFGRTEEGNFIWKSDFLSIN